VADVCDYVYVSGMRFKSGTPFVELASTDLAILGVSGVTSDTVKLAVVRDGKGSSRVTRWADKPARFGVSGEINLRDLRRVLESSNQTDVTAFIPTDTDSLISVAFDPSASMGRQGRLIDVSELEDTLLSLPDSQCQFLVRSQLENMPYGMENSRAAAMRLQVLLRHASPDMLSGLIKDGHVDFVRHIDRDTLSNAPDAAISRIVGALASYNGDNPSVYQMLSHIRARKADVEIERIKIDLESLPEERDEDYYEPRYDRQLSTSSLTEIHDRISRSAEVAGPGWSLIDSSNLASLVASVLERSPANVEGDIANMTKLIPHPEDRLAVVVRVIPVDSPIWDTTPTPAIHPDEQGLYEVMASLGLDTLTALAKHNNNKMGEYARELILFSQETKAFGELKQDFLDELKKLSPASASPVSKSVPTTPLDPDIQALYDAIARQEADGDVY
jgi:hypothetical protein